MVPIPPKHRAFITVPAGLQSESIPAPEGFSLVTTHVYTKLSLFYDNVNKDPTFMNWPYMKRNIEKALNYYYPLTGRLVKGQNGRYSITNFDKGALFEVHDSADLFGDWKKHNFSYSVVPYDEMIPIKSYVSRDSPLFGVKMIYTKDGGAVMNMSFHHKVVDGWCLVQFISLLGRICRGEKIEDDEIFLYTDKDRKPVQPLPNMNYSEFYPSYGPGEMPPPTINLAGPSKKFIFTFEKEAMLKLKKTTLEEAGQPKAKISQFDVLCSFIHRSVVKARRAPADSRADMVCIVGNHQNHPDENMVKYFGNFIMPIPVPNTAEQVMDKSIFDLATELRKQTHSVSVPFMESLEHYFNHAENVETIVGPIARLTRGGVGFSDWSRFVNNFDFGYGQHIRLRSFVDPSPMALITIMPFIVDKIEVIINLDKRSMDRLITDRDFMSFVKCVN